MTTMTVSPQFRLTRRGQAVVTVLGAVLATLLFGLGHLPSTHASGDASTLPATSTVVVHPGETLWQIAQRLAPGKDPRVLVHKIEELNGLTSAAVQAGQRLYVPA